MKRLGVLTAVLAAATFSPVSGQISYGPQLSWGDGWDFGIGGRVEVPFTQFMTAEEGSPLSMMRAIGSFDWFFPDDGGVDGLDISYFEINANAAYPFAVEGLRPYAGGGLNVSRWSSSFGGSTNSDTKFGLNVLGGLNFMLSTFDAFAEARFELSGGEQFVLTFGVLFP